MLRSVGAGEPNNPGGESPDDEILEGLVKAATVQSAPRETRRRARQFNRKSCGGLLFCILLLRFYTILALTKSSRKNVEN